MWRRWTRYDIRHPGTRRITTLLRQPEVVPLFGRVCHLCANATTLSRRSGSDNECGIRTSNFGAKRWRRNLRRPLEPFPRGAVTRFEIVIDDVDTSRSDAQT